MKGDSCYTFREHNRLVIKSVKYNTSFIADKDYHHVITVTIGVTSMAC